MLATRRSKT